MKILVTGANGQVGSELLQAALAIKYNVEVVGYGRSLLDITDIDQVKSILAKEKPNVVINAAAYTAVDKAEEEINLAYAINEKGPENLASFCNELSIPLLHISTDYVFDGSKIGAYAETDVPNPTGIYGKSKLAGEQAVIKNHPLHYILRVAWVFGEFGNNFVKTMVRLGKEREQLRVVADQKGAPTYAKDIAETLLKLAVQINSQTSNWGIYHYCGDTPISWHGFAQIIFEQAKQNNILTSTPKVLAITTKEYPTPAERPLNSILNCDKITQTFKLDLSNWQAGLGNVFNAWK
ncbi:dTDP-4-dehydrorhamnose reductase [Colwellia sp. Bg11-28]|uniref:dTDP-4-dehydrorhamnose reductase n=1 Tax=Colwellia sp. Bg11-28 TaxID=2058305 RepID=UPI000C31DA44|nr:dTDP-4-dehydrorhamnose reductase [Colwellia sp. Bg11-28]PKH85175.1 dTDP-4-dehydrorhamnose reductase [Colwellia sp. Bg11-28]